jgi:predicted glycoside hydrolase/deacetylase ChbG (UPF0249 family)
MKDYQTSVEHLRKEAAETRLIADLATDKANRETFVKLADDLKALADEVEHAMAVHPEHLAKLIELGLVEMRDGEPYLTPAGQDVTWLRARF